MSSMKTQARNVTFTSVVLVLLSLGSGGLGIKHYSLVKERNRLATGCAMLEGKAMMLKKGYSEQKALAENSLRARQAAEAKAARTNQLLADREADGKELKAKVAELAAQAETQQEAQKRQEGQVREAIAQWKAKVDELTGSVATSQAKIREQQARIAELNTVVTTTKAQLESESRQYTSCREKNVTLASLARELANSYRQKGVLDILATKEPLTKLNKVKLEKLIQEYLDRIDSQALPQTGANRP